MSLKFCSLACPIIACTHSVPGRSFPLLCYMLWMLHCLGSLEQTVKNVCNILFLQRVAQCLELLLVRSCHIRPDQFLPLLWKVWRQFGLCLVSQKYFLDSEFNLVSNGNIFSFWVSIEKSQLSFILQPLSKYWQLSFLFFLDGMKEVSSKL